MATDIYPGGLGHQRLAGAANGVALSTTADIVPLFLGTKQVDFIPRNFSTAVVWRYIECPWLTILKTHNALASGPIWDYSEVAQDGDTAALFVLSSLPTLADGGAVWVGAAVPYRGADFDVSAVNGTASNLTVHYPNQALTLTDISDTDNTDTGPSLAQDGTVTWTVPTAPAWKPATLREILPANGLAIRAARFPHDDEVRYWTRWTWNAAMDAATTLVRMTALNESTAYPENPGDVGLGHRVHVGPGLTGLSAYEVLTNAGTGNLLVNCSTLDGRFLTGSVGTN